MTFTNTFKRKACRVIAALAAVACTMSLAACGADETGKIRIGIKFDQPGLGFKKSGTYVGFDVDVAKYVAKKLGYSEDEIVWKEAPSKQREAMLQNGDVDMHRRHPTPSPTSARRPSILRRPVLRGRTGSAGAQGRQLGIDGPEGPERQAAVLRDRLDLGRHRQGEVRLRSPS